MSLPSRADLWLILATLLSPACSGESVPDASAAADAGAADSGGPGLATGSGTGRFADFEFASAGAFAWSSSGGEGIIVSSVPELCMSLGEEGRETPRSWSLAVFLTVDPEGEDVPPGTYPVTGEWTTVGAVRVAADAFVRHTDSMCQDTLSIPVSLIPSGDVEIVEIGESHIRGRLDVAWDGDQLLGEFDAPRCLAHASAPECVAD